VKELHHKFSRQDPDWFDEDGRLVWKQDALHLNFGKHRDKPLSDVDAADLSYTDWMLQQDFSEDVKNAIRQTRNGSPPVRAA